MAGSAVGRGIGQAHALDAARIVGWEFLALDRHREVWTAVLGAQTQRAKA